MIAKPSVTGAAETKPAALTATIVGVVVIGALYWAQTVLIPVALAFFLAFLLAPPVSALQRRHVGRVPSVVLIVLFTALMLGGVVWLVKIELSSLARELPAYTENIQTKVKYLRLASGSAGAERFDKIARDITGEFGRTFGDGNSTLDPPRDGETSSARGNSPPVEIPAAVPAAVPEAAPAVPTDIPAWLSRLAAFFRPVIASLGRLALSLVLVVFILLERETLRDRLIRLVGNGHMTATTKALDDAGGRISHYLLIQFSVNATYGVSWGLILYFIGVDYALLWGFLAAVLRYVPYVGAPSAALLPITLSLAQFPGWWPPLAVIGMFLASELVFNNAVEPYFYGKSIGVSAVTMLVAVAFWTFLWGPVGLVLSGPLTICLVVLGNHVPGLNFFAVLLGDTPALETDVRYYQRLLARDQNEAAQIVLTRAKVTSMECIYDELLVPALVYTARDRERHFLTEADEQFIFRATHAILDTLEERRSADRLAAVATSPAIEFQAPPARIRVLACPARNHADRLALEMLRQLLDPAKWHVEVTALETLTAELVAHATNEHSALICIGALPPGGLAHARYLCKRIRTSHPNLKIVVGRWGLQGNLDADREQVQAVGADLFATTLLETRKQLNDWLPVLAYEGASSVAS